MKAIEKYILIDGVPQLCDSEHGWVDWMNKNEVECQVEYDRVKVGDVIYHVSTVFTGMDPHRLPAGSLLYETLISGSGSFGGQAMRASTEFQASVNHSEAIVMMGGEVLGQEPESPPEPEPEPAEKVGDGEEDGGSGPDEEGGDDGDAVEEPIADSAGPGQEPLPF